MSCCGGSSEIATMAPAVRPMSLMGESMNLVLMQYIGRYESEYINCPGSGNHYRAGTAEGLRQFQAQAGDVDELIAQGVAKRVDNTPADALGDMPAGEDDPSPEVDA